MLDRGQLMDWFQLDRDLDRGRRRRHRFLSVRRPYADREGTFISPALFKDRNFFAGNIFIFVVGVVLFATLALLPPLLQNLMNYRSSPPGW